MSTYDNPVTINHTFGLFDFGGAAVEILSFKGPPGKVGVIKQIGVSVIEAFLVDTGVGRVRVGTAADNDAYAELNIPDAVADEAYFSQVDDTDAIKALTIPADQLVEVNLVNGTDGSGVTGQGWINILIDWF